MRVFEPQLFRDFKWRSQTKQITQQCAFEIRVHRIITAIVTWKDWVGPVRLAQVIVQLLPQAFEVVVSIILEERRYYLIHY